MENPIKKWFSNFKTKPTLKSQPSSLIQSRLFGFEDCRNENKTQKTQKLIDEGYGGNVTLFSIINKIVTTASNVNLYVADENGEVIEGEDINNIVDYPATYRGKNLNTSEWVEVALTYLLLTGDLYQKGLEIVGFKNWQGYEIIPSGIIEPTNNVRSYLTQNTSFTVYDKQKTLVFNSDVISHLKYINPTTYGLNSLKGLSPLQAGLYSLTGSTDIQKAIAVMVKNQGVRGILTNKTDRSGQGVRLNSSQAKQIKKRINDTIRGVDKINSVHVTSAELDYLPMGMNASDLKLIESGVLTDRQLCNMFGVDSKLFNDPSASTFNNLTEATKGLYVNAILPNLNKLVSDFNDIIIKQYNNINGTKYSLKIDTSDIEALQKNQKEIAEKNKLNAEGINVILASNTDIKGKIEQLINIYGMAEDVATNIVGNETNEG